MSEIPASVLLIFHIVVNFTIVYTFARIFDLDWRVMNLYDRRYVNKEDIVDKDDIMGVEIERSDRKCAFTWPSGKKMFKRAYRAIMLLAFLAIPMGLNILYVDVVSKISSDVLIGVQLTLLLCNASLRLALPIIVPNLFRKKGSRYHNFSSVFFLAFLLSFIDVAVPFTATLFQSDLCFHQYIPGFGPKSVSIKEKEIPICTSFWTNGSCYEPSLTYIPHQIIFDPPLFYSEECRDAVLQNYLPLVIYACGFSAFAMPVLHFLLSFRLYDLRKEIVIFGHTFRAAKFVLPDLNYLIILIWGDFLLLLTYGIISPYATLAIGANIYSQIYTARTSVCRYYYLQFYSLKNREIVERNHNHLENICENCQQNIHAMLWPGIAIGTLLFGLYLFEMALNSTHSNGYGIPIFLMSCTYATVPLAALFYHYMGNRTQQSLETRIDSGEKSEVPGSFGSGDDAVIKNPITVAMTCTKKSVEGNVANVS